MTEQLGRGRQRLVPARQRSRRPAGRRAVARAAGRGAGCAAVGGALHRRRHRERQPRRQGALLGAAGRRLGDAGASSSAPPSTTPSSTASSGWRSTTAPTSRGCRSSRPGASRPEALADALGTRRGRCRRQRDVGQQRDRHGQRHRRARRGGPGGRGARCTPTPSRRPAVPVDFAAGAWTRSRWPGTSSAARRAPAFCAARAPSAPRCCTAAARSATCGPARWTSPAIVGLAVGDGGRGGAPGRARAGRLAALRGPAGRPASWSRCPTCSSTGRRSATSSAVALAGSPATPTCRSPAAEGDALLMLLDARGMECSNRLGLQRRCRPARPRAAGGRRRTPTARAAPCASPSGTPPPMPTSTPVLEVIAPVVERARRGRAWGSHR